MQMRSFFIPLGIAVGGSFIVTSAAVADVAFRPSTKSSHMLAAKKKAKPTKKAKKAKEADTKVTPPDTGVAPAAAPVLDLSEAGSDTDAARQELLNAPAEGKKEEKKGKGGGGGFDFGGGASLDLGSGDAVDFGNDLGELDIKLDINSAEATRFEQALSLMSDEDYSAASVEFRYFLDDEKYAEFKSESEYQLAKAYYKLGFVEASLQRFRGILEQGSTHKRYKKSVEWLFFISRKVADETPVLAELARFRNVTFPKAYRNEYRYLLSKYLFGQAQRFEVQRLQEEQLAKGKKSKAATLDFSAIEQAVSSGDAGFDFGGAAGAMDFGGDTGGGFDFGGGKPAKKDAKPDDGGFDFGGGGGSGGSGGGGFDFGGGTPEAAPDADQPTREAAPTNARDAITQGLDFVTQVEKNSKFYARAKYLEGLLHYLNGQDQKAVEAFQEVVRVLNPRTATQLDPKLRESAFLSLARIHYGYRQFDRAVYYYDQIERDSENWLTALFESSWAYYARGDFEKALGNLLTLHSPFFEREYFPESQLVKAIIYFEACRYGETRTLVDQFISRFTEVMREVEKIAQSKEAPELLYERIAQLQKEATEKSEDVTARVVSLALNDADIRTARDAVNEVNAQLDALRQQSDAFRQSKAGVELAEQLKELLVTRSREAGETTRRKFEQELYDLKSLLAQSLRIKIEVAKAERDTLEKKLRKESTEEIEPAVARTVVDDEHVYWPYEGEYWRDELGTYELDFAMCAPAGSGS